MDQNTIMIKIIISPNLSRKCKADIVTKRYIINVNFIKLHLFGMGEGVLYRKVNSNNMARPQSYLVLLCQTLVTPL